MARPRVILACGDAEAAVRMIAALNPKRYRVEHLRDLNEAILRAQLVLAHAIVIHGPSPSESRLREITQVSKRVTPVFVSDDRGLARIAQDLAARFVAEPFDVYAFKRAVYRAVSKTQDKRHHARASDSQTRALKRVLLVHHSTATGAVMAAVLRNQLGATCDVVTTPGEALLLLEEEIHCFIAEPSVLLSSRDGFLVARDLARRGIPLVPLSGGEVLDASTAGQAAWDIAPQVRRSLTARANGSRRVAEVG